MFKTVILGCENSHADSFLDLIANDPDFAEIEVIGIYSDEEESTKKLHERFNVPVMSSFDEAVGKVDGVIVTARHGNNHLKYARPYIAKGVSFFIDKPFTICPAEGEELVKLLESSGCLFTGGSSLKHCEFVKELKAQHNADENGKTVGGFVRAPIDRASVYGGFYFYAPHLVEIVAEIYGAHPKSVCANENVNGISALFRYDDFDVSGMYLDKNYVYYAARHSEKGVCGKEFPVDASCFKAEFAEFRDILCGKSYGQAASRMMAPVYIMNALEESMKNNGKEISVR
ncbi:MAG: Gfo/Idh/MocA family oxidoreductase [Clostridia bacterium]|nr:Gfo/Idh/MocA family oxidoreductase [Clostridia bacterium]